MANRMKKVGFGFLFGLAGLIYEWGLPLIMTYLSPGDGIGTHGEDEAERQLRVYFFLGGALFFLLWAWIGTVFAENRRKAIRMVMGVFIATVIITVIPRFISTLHVMPDDWRFDALFVCAWAVVSAGLAYMMGRNH